MSDKKSKIWWQPHPGPQTEALSRGEDEILLGGARGGGKTDAGIVWLVHPSHLHHPKYRFLVIRKNAKDLSDWVDRARTMYIPLGAEIVGQNPEIRFPSGAIGRTGHLKDANAFEQYIGHEYSKILIEELTLIPSEESYEKLISSCRSSIPDLPARVFATTNPGNAGHLWVFNRFVKHGMNQPYQDKISGKWRIFIPSRVEDNPTLMDNDPNYVHWLESLPEKLRQSWRYGDWSVFAGQFFDTWDDRIHTYRPFEIPSDWPRFRAIDWGYSDHFCCLWFAVGPNNHIYVYREFYRNKLTDPEYCYFIKTMSKYPNGKDEDIGYTVGDPNSFGEELQEFGVKRFETFANHGVSVIPADNSRVEGWTRVREYLNPHFYKEQQVAWLHISQDCPNLIRTLPALVHHERKVEDIADNMEDHACDALRYGVMTRPPLFIQPPKKYRTNLEAAEAQMERKMKQRQDSWA